MFKKQGFLTRIMCFQMWFYGTYHCLYLWINLDASIWTKLNWIDKLMSYDTISEMIVQCVLKSRCWYVGQSSFLKRAHERAWGHSSNQRFTNSNHFGITSEFWSIRHCIEVKDFHFSSSRSFVWKKNIMCWVKIMQYIQYNDVHTP